MYNFELLDWEEQPFKCCNYFQIKREREKIECDVENLRDKSETQKLDNDQMRDEITFLRLVHF